MKYAQYVQDACDFFQTHQAHPSGSPPRNPRQQKQRRVSACLMEGGMSVAGVILPPEGYLKTAVDAVRQAGGLYIADEVQTGFGRLGTSMWAFQHRNNSNNSHNDEVVPDIVTVGKPFGNGMPLAAVVTTRKVAEAFEEMGVKYFNTFGGNPVSAAAGLAVLDALESSQLQQNAQDVGDFLWKELKHLQQLNTIIGDLRGSGFFLGIEFVRDHVRSNAADVETSLICSVLKDKYSILTIIIYFFDCGGGRLIGCNCGNSF